MQLRNYQKTLVAQIIESHTRVKNSLAVLATGGGKTVIFSEIIRLHQHEPCCAIAHRQELVNQISIALARNGIKHRIIAPNTVIRNCIQDHISEVGKSWYDPNSTVAVAGVDTLIRRSDDPTLKQWFNSVKLWVTDEAHHVLIDNKWGKGARLFPNARGLGVTATPIRADGRGLGSHHDGLFDEMIVGQSMRQLINEGFLTNYRIFAPPSDINLNGLKVSGTTGDYNQKELAKRTKESHIVGDIVRDYLRFAKGQLGITFVPDVETAHLVANQFNANGVPAIALSAKTPDAERKRAIKAFGRREYLQLVNVDLFGEGFDLPACSVASMARKTESYSLFAQQFGRVLRPADGKTHAIIIDHVGNVLRHGLPDAHKEWTLDRREKRAEKDPDEIPIRACTKCLEVYEGWEKVCPFCGHKHLPAERSAPEFVEGDLTEMDEEMLNKLRGDVEHANKLKIPYGANDVIRTSLEKKHVNRTELVNQLSDAIDHWAGVQVAGGLSIKAAYMKFYRNFGIDTVSALGQKTVDLQVILSKVVDQS